MQFQVLKCKYLEVKKSDLPEIQTHPILYLSSLPASLKKIRTKMKAISCPQHFPYY